MQASKIFFRFIQEFYFRNDSLWGNQGEVHRDYYFVVTRCLVQEFVWLVFGVYFDKYITWQQFLCLIVATNNGFQKLRYFERRFVGEYNFSFKRGDHKKLGEILCAKFSAGMPLCCFGADPCGGPNQFEKGVLKIPWPLYKRMTRVLSSQTLPWR